MPLFALACEIICRASRGYALIQAPHVNAQSKLQVEMPENRKTGMGTRSYTDNSGNDQTA
jgi:hypothetical protein